jgi:uncharacterized membrane protein YjgN (DUF898 family)
MDEVTLNIPIHPEKRPLGQNRRLNFRGSGGEIFGIFLLNALLTILTLGIYSFWAKVRVRSYIWSKTEFDGDRLAYHGTPKELMNGSGKAFLYLFLPLMVINQLPAWIEPKETLSMVAAGLTYGLIMAFLPLAMVGAYRYRLSRTSWRGVLFSFRGNTWKFARLFLSGLALSILTLGIYYPIFDVRRYEFMVSNSYFGQEKFRFDGNGRALLRPFLFALLLTIPTMGLYWFWYLARRKRFLWEHTAFDTLRFQSTVTGGKLLAQHLGNLLLLIITLGLAWPWVTVRKIRFVFNYLTLDGVMDPTKIRQEAQSASATGEALSGFMDTGFDLG